jgi:hypothetical protein
MRKRKFYKCYEEISVNFLLSHGLSGRISGAITIGKGSQKIRKKSILAKGRSSKYGYRYLYDGFQPASKMNIPYAAMYMITDLTDDDAERRPTEVEKYGMPNV